MTAKAICEGVRIPDGLLLSYPAIMLDKYTLMPSRFLTFFDPVVPFAFLQLCVDQYIPNEEMQMKLSKTDPFINPFLIPDHVVKMYPPTVLCVGDYDPLYDDAISFGRRLWEAGRTVHVTVYRELPHGYLSFRKLMGGVIGMCHIALWIHAASQFLSLSLSLSAGPTVREAGMFLQKLANKEYSWFLNANSPQ